MATAPTPILPDQAPWKVATAAVHSWRGEMVDVMAKAEVAVSKTLVSLNEVAEKPTRKLPHLVGLRFSRLTKLVAEDGAFAGVGRHVRDSLEAFCGHERVRTTICHGVVHVGLDVRGRWIAMFKTMAIAGGRVEASNLALTQDDAEALLVKVRDDGQRLSTDLGNLRVAAKNRSSSGE